MRKAVEDYDFIRQRMQEIQKEKAPKEEPIKEGSPVSGTTSSTDVECMVCHTTGWCIHKGWMGSII